MNADEKYGRLRCVSNGAEGTEVIGYQPFEFISADSIDLDEIKIHLTASYAMDDCWGSGYWANMLLQSALNANITNPTVQQNVVGATCKDGEDVGIKTIKLIVNLPEEKTQKITGENPPKMPKLKITAQLKNFNKGSVYFQWFMTIEWNGEGNWKTPRNTELYQGDATSSNSDIVDLNVNLDQYDMRGGEKIKLRVEATADGKGYMKEFENPFEIKGVNPNKSDIRSEIAVVAPSKVWNYEAIDVNMLNVIIYKESTFRQFNASPGYPLQGYEDKDDFGVMQINNPSNDTLIWNWKLNIAGGMGKHNEKKKAVRDYIDHIKQGICGIYKTIKTKEGKDTTIWKAVNQPVPSSYYGDEKKQFKYNPTAMTEEQKIKETFQRYNGGVFYRWVPKDTEKPLGAGEWQEEPTKKNGVYGNDAMNIYNNVLNGIFPPGWN